MRQRFSAARNGHRISNKNLCTSANENWIARIKFVHCAKSQTMFQKGKPCTTYRLCAYALSSPSRNIVSIFLHKWSGWILTRLSYTSCQWSSYPSCHEHVSIKNSLIYTSRSRELRYVLCLAPSDLPSRLGRTLILDSTDLKCVCLPCEVIRTENGLMGICWPPGPH